MNKMIQIRKEEEKDYRSVEEITRDSFWNVYVPGCNEHF
jgi:putative acetyltransferase